MKKVIITGVTGFIGGHVALNLLQKGIFVYGVDIDSSKFSLYEKYPNFKKVIADFTRYGELSKLINDNIDVFFHFAWAGGFTSAITDYSVQLSNAKYAGDAAKAAADIGVRKFVYAGTYNEFEIASGFLSSAFSPRKTCVYSSGKLVADVICRTLCNLEGIDYCSALIPMPYGENNFSMQLVNVVLKQLANGERPKLVEGNNLYDLVYINDIAEAFYHIGESGIDKHKYYIGHRKLKTFKELFIEVGNLVAPEIELGFGEYKDNQTIDYSLIDLDALYNDTGFECNSDFKETILKTFDWVKNNL